MCAALSSEGIKLLSTGEYIFFAMMVSQAQNKQNCLSLLSRNETNNIFVKSTPSKLFPVTKIRDLDEHVTHNVNTICKRLTIKVEIQQLLISEKQWNELLFLYSKSLENF